MNTLIDRAVLLANYFKACRKGRFRTRAALETHQSCQLTRFADQVLTRSPFYAPIAHLPLADMPVMSKSRMLAEFDRINTRGLRKAAAFELAEAAERSRDFTAMIEDVSVGLSTGTSGQRGLFVASRRERMRWAGIMLGRMLHGSLLEQHRIAFLLRANNQLYESVSGKARIAFRFFDLKQPLDELMIELAAFKPTILIAPAQILRELALRQVNSPPRHDKDLRPTRLISVAETLFDDDRAIIERTFKTRVEEIYQATEGFLAYTCPAGRLHLNEMFVHVEPEWIDEAEGLFSPIITDFCRETQPTVRYRLDDILRLDRRACSCGSPEHVLKRVEGRADDSLELPAREPGRVVALLPDFVARALAGAIDRETGAVAIEDFRVRQTSHDKLDIRLAGPDHKSAQTTATAAIQKLCHEHGAITPQLTFAPMSEVDFLEKRRRIVREGREA